MLVIVLLSTFIATVSAQTCANSNGQGVCLKMTVNTVDIYMCPEGMTCLRNETCCKNADVQYATSAMNADAISCVDKVNPSTGVSDCASKADLCLNSIYQSLMKEECPRTCGYC